MAAGQRIQDLELTRLTISNVSKRHGHHHHLKIPQLLSSIASYVESECTGLTFQDIDLPGDFNGGSLCYRPSGTLPLGVHSECVHPSSTRSSAAFARSRTVFIEDQTIDDCPLDECSVRFADSCKLVVDQHPHPKALFVFFHLASAQTMTVSNCQSLDDHALQALSKVGSATAELPCMHGLYGLEISGCPVSFAGLQNMVAGRRRNAEALNVPFEEDHFDPYNHENPPIMSLDITQDDLYRFSDAEQTWLNDNVKSFHYRRHRLQIPA
ncbi:hypothetical protein BKA70DRAFT_1342192 [Coprinopsis sp. MPI-PUGE-AT-0042]|nr:hypothetical protein BKA70DRAFT_1342192 [Coprinopsis sp. MPI-PUGE-AT-0042]